MRKWIATKLCKEVNFKEMDYINPLGTGIIATTKNT